MKKILLDALEKEEESKLPNHGRPRRNVDFTGYRIRNIINNVCSNQDIRYMEVGLYRGGTFSAALFENAIKAVGIDNWSQDEWRRGKGTSKEQFYRTIHPIQGKNSVKIIQNNCWDVKYEDTAEHLNNKKINVYFFDGPHGYDDQYRALTEFIDFLDDEFIFFVDDCDESTSPHVLEATLNAIKDLNLEILFEKRMPAQHPGDLDRHTPAYWEGFYAAALRKK
jgi:hypothetical protein